MIVNQVPSLEASSFLAGQEILRNFWSPKFDYIVHKGLPFVAVLITDPDEDWADDLHMWTLATKVSDK